MREGRLGRADPEAVRYTSSLSFDRALFECDVLNDMAHVVMLIEEKIIPREDGARVLGALKELLEKGVGALKLGEDFEDIHEAIEDHIISRAGDAGARMHTARSRNDQVACDLRMLVRGETAKAIAAVLDICATLSLAARETAETVMPGYTHLQHAQPTTMGHHFLAWNDVLMRCASRMEGALKRCNLSPLGSCALAGTSFSINRQRTAQLLGFDGIVENSEDAVASRDFLLEALSNTAMLMVETSRIMEELIIWSSSEFKFIELSDELSSTSSIMPQKKNPDIIELARARTGVAIGNLSSGLSILKSLPYSYNRDLQELSPLVLRSFELSTATLRILDRTLKTVKINKIKMLSTCASGFATATDLADLLVRDYNLPFRKAHQVVGRMVSKAMDAGMPLENVDPALLDSAAGEVIGEPLKLDAEKLKLALDPMASVSSRVSAGAAAPGEVKRMAKERSKEIEAGKRGLQNFNSKLERAREDLKKAVAAYLKK